MCATGVSPKTSVKKTTQHFPDPLNECWGQNGVQKMNNRDRKGEGETSEERRKENGGYGIGKKAVLNQWL